MNLSSRLTDFEASLKNYKATDQPGGQITDMYNTLLGMAQEELSGDPVVVSLKPLEKSSLGGSTAEVGEIQMLVGQIKSAIPRRAPRLA